MNVNSNNNNNDNNNNNNSDNGILKEKWYKNVSYNIRITVSIHANNLS